MHKVAPFGTDACNTPVYYTPVSVHPKKGVWDACSEFARNLLGTRNSLVHSEFQVGMNGDPFSIKAPKECSKKFPATFKGKFPTRGNVPY